MHDFSSESSTPAYAILSHTWGSQELSYFDFLFLTSDLPPGATNIVRALLRNPSRDGPGYRKVAACCELARSRGIEWVWIDSCCIDKSSSAELSEAINSMWSWYRGAVECYAHLGDVSFDEDSGPGLSRVKWFQISHARWFSRGWTLQELLAPNKVLFCNDQWEIFAEKSEVVAELSHITNIPSVFLDGTHDPSDHNFCSVAMKMNWLSRRETTRTEDMAYCMLGLFDVNMPLIYGEGRKAFMRLQLEIIRKIDDDSIYAWRAPIQRSGLLAPWPTAFANSGNIVQVEFPNDRTPWLPPVMTPIGLEMRGRYSRNDPHQQAIDAQHKVLSISTALYTRYNMTLLMHCTPCERHSVPVTQTWGPGESGGAFVIRMRRFGATWQRVNCEELVFENYAGSDSDQSTAYVIFYVEQQGM